MRAKLLATYAVNARLLDALYQAVLAPYSEKGKPPKSLLPDPPAMEQPTMTRDEMNDFDDIMGITRHGGS
mgnify:FL=1